MKRTFALVLAMVLLVVLTVGATLAYLQDTTKVVENVFTVGNVDIDLNETTGDTYKLVAGTTLSKNPKVTVIKGSDECYVFVKVVETNNPKNYMDYSIADGWTALTGETGVYYREVNVLEDEADAVFSVLANDQVVVKTTLNNTDMDAANAAQPKITFTAYAVQKANVESAAAAWEIVKNLAYETGSYGAGKYVAPAEG